MKNKNFILNFIFISGIVLMFFNDHFFKIIFYNWFTGKFSDFLGIIILPFLLAFLFPKLKQNSVLIVALFFIFWKSEFSQNIIELYNKLSLIKIGRVVDYSDFISLFLLPIPYFLIKNFRILDRISFKKVSSSIILFPSILVLMSTSPPRYYSYVLYQGNINFNNYVIEINRDQNLILSELKRRNVYIHKDTARIIKENRYRLLSDGKLQYNDFMKSSDIFKINNDSLKMIKLIEDSDYYKIDSLKIGDEIVKDIQFTMGNVDYGKKGIYTRIGLEALRTDKNLSEKSAARKLRKIYKKLLEKEFNYFLEFSPN